MKIPDWLHVGALVRVQHWYGEVEDVAVSDQRIMVLVASPKGVWRNHPAEWLEFGEKQIAPAEPEAAIRDANTYLEYIERMTHALVAMRERWKEKAFAHAAQK